MLRRRASRSEDGDSGADVGESVEAAGELGGNVADSVSVCCPHGRGFVPQPNQQLLIEGGCGMAGIAQSTRKFPTCAALEPPARDTARCAAAAG
jgi:hypothetical protein